MPRFAKGNVLGFKPSQSGNPGGRPKALPELVDACRAHTPAAVERLAQIVADKDAPPAAQIAAAIALLDRGWGKPMQPLSGDDEGGVMLGVVLIPRKDACA